MRAARTFALALVLLAGCAEPEPEPTPLERAREVSRARAEAQEMERARERSRVDSPRASLGKARVALGLKEDPPTPARIKRELLATYGAELTPFQRSALQSARLSTYAEGEAMCKKWIEENRRFERGQ